jgi:16S rRNA (cytosine1402-N4)-methyltransferase
VTQEFIHTSVLRAEVLTFLEPRSGGVYLDGTLGGGGHAEAILEASAPDGRLIGIDRDPAALAATRARLARFGERATLVHGNYGEARAILERCHALPVDGIVLDLGISSPQVDHAERGFSFQREGPLDMRMDTTQGLTAAELLRELTVDELADVLHRYGEEPFSKKIARAVKEALAEDRLHSTLDLAEVVANALPARERQHRVTDPATRTFQALRIVVNDELGGLERFLADFPALLRPGGRLVVIAFHSLEDRLVKDRLRDLSRHPGLPRDVAEAMGIRPDPELELLTRKPVYPSAEEIQANPRSRSARLRAGERR